MVTLEISFLSMFLILWCTEQCSESMGIINALFFFASFIKNSPAITKGSLFAINTFFPDFIEW